MGRCARILALLTVAGQVAASGFGQTLPRHLDLELGAAGRLLPVAGVVGDLSGDGLPELVFGCEIDDGCKLGFRDLSGRVLHQIEIPHRPLELLPGPDADRDGLGDLLLVTTCLATGHFELRLWSCLSGREIWSLRTGSVRPRVAPCPDLDGDGVRDLILIGHSGLPEIVSGWRGRRLNAPRSVTGWMPEDVVGGQFDGDPGVEVVVAARGLPGRMVRAYDLGSGEAIWEIALEGTTGPASLAVTHDLDGDLRDDIVVGLPDLDAGRGAIRVLSSADGRDLGQHPGLVEGGRYGHQVRRAGRMDGSGWRNLLVLARDESEGGAVHVLRGDAEEPISTWEAEPGYRILSVLGHPGLDANGDSFDDMVVVLEPTEPGKKPRMQVIAVAGVSAYGQGRPNLRLTWEAVQGLGPSTGHLRLSGGRPGATVLLALSTRPALIAGPGLFGDILIDTSPGGFVLAPVKLDQEGDYTIWYLSLRVPQLAGRLVYAQALQLGEDAGLSNGLQALLVR